MKHLPKIIAAASILMLGAVQPVPSEFFTTFVLMSVSDEGHEVVVLTTAAAYCEVFGETAVSIDAIRCDLVKDRKLDLKELHDLWVQKGFIRKAKDDAWVSDERRFLALLGRREDILSECAFSVEDGIYFRSTGAEQFVATNEFYRRFGDLRAVHRVGAGLILRGYEVSFGGYRPEFSLRKIREKTEKK